MIVEVGEKERERDVLSGHDACVYQCVTIRPNAVQSKPYLIGIYARSGIYAINRETLHEPLKDHAEQLSKVTCTQTHAHIV